METLESINAWRPDWRKAESYPPIGNWSPVYKAWELLRRQREYQEDFIHFANGTIFEKYNHIALRDGDHWIITPDGERVFPQIYFSGKYLIGMLGVVVVEDDKVIRNKDGYPSPYKRSCCLRPPCVNAPPRFTATGGVRTLTSYMEAKEGKEHKSLWQEVKNNQVGFVLDIDKPIKFQLNGLEEIFRALRNDFIESNKKTEKKYLKLADKTALRHLRLLDAFFEKDSGVNGIEDDEIHKTLCASGADFEPNKLSGYKKDAEDWSNNKYKQFLVEALNPRRGD